jgi:hypothetical protein
MESTQRRRRAESIMTRAGAMTIRRRACRIAAIAAMLASVVLLVPSAGAAGSLPDGRGYELVSPPGGDREIYSPRVAWGDENDVVTQLPFRASANGDAVTYIGDPGPTEGNGNTGGGGGNSYISVRGPSRWTTQNIMPPTVGGEYSTFSADLSTSILSYVDRPPEFPALTAEVAGNPDLVGCAVLYERATATGALHALSTTTTTPHFCGIEEEEPVFVAGNSGAGSVPAFSHVLFQTSAALLTGDEESLGEGSDNLYESEDGTLKPVNILGGLPDPNATFGAPGEGPVLNSSNVISADGSRIVWTDLKTNRIYIRENGTTTIPVSEGAARYWTASRDDSSVYYVEEGALWRFDVGAPPGSQHVLLAGEGLASEPPEVEGVIGIGETKENGPYVYFVATQRLATGTNRNGEKAEASALNLYVENRGATTFIGKLSLEDDGIAKFDGRDTLGDWQVDPGLRTATVSPDGSHLAFLSVHSLTGYDNKEEQFEIGPTFVPELFVYDAAANSLACASCDPNGNPPSELTGSLSDPASSQPGGAVAPVSSNLGFMPRWMTSNGERVFFDTVENLSSQDHNARTQDVYEWEQAGVGSCGATASRGCIYLISSGTSNDRSYFVDASASGDNVFLTTRSKLTPAITGETFSLYDARIGAEGQPPAVGCIASSCEATPPQPAPLNNQPLTVGLTGAGNFPPSLPIQKKQKTAAEIRHEHLTKALRQCRKKHSQRKRRACEAQATRKYGLAKTPKRGSTRKTKGNR